MNAAQSARMVTSFDLPTKDGVQKFAAGERILWRDPFGIGGIVIAASILGADATTPCTVGLNVEVSEVVRAVAEWVRESSGVGVQWPEHGLGDGGKVFVTGEAFGRAVYDGKIRRAATDEEGRARDEAELAAEPYWWATRREDQEREATG